MRIGIIGAGAIGSLVAGYLQQKGDQVTLVARDRETASRVSKEGVHISGVRGAYTIGVEVSEALPYKPEIVILATKTQDLPEALRKNSRVLQGATVLTIQNGIQADAIVAESLGRERVISSIVMFGATSLEPGVVVHNFEGSWIIGNMWGANNETVIAASMVFNTIFSTYVTEDIKGMKYLKVFVNVPNCIPAVLGVSMQEAFRDARVSAISIALWREGLSAVRSAGIELVSLPDFPLERITKLTSIPVREAAAIYTNIMTSLSAEPLYGSMLQSIKKKRPTEIDYINGEFVRLAQEHNSQVPLNSKLIDMVHEVERTGVFFEVPELLSNTKGLFNEHG